MAEGVSGLLNRFKFVERLKFSIIDEVYLYY